MQVGLKVAYDCIQAFSETDFTDDFKALKAPMLIAHGDADQIRPHRGRGHEVRRARRTLRYRRASLRKVIEIDSSHLVVLTHPKEVATFIADAINELA